MGNQKIQMATDGLHWMGETDTAHYDLYKKKSATLYQLGEGKNYCIIEFLENNRIKHSCAGSSYVFYYTRLSIADENKTTGSNQNSNPDPSNTKPASYSASSIENGEWTATNDFKMKMKLIKVDEAIILMNSHTMEKGFAEVYKKISPEHYRYAWSEDTSAHSDIMITGTNKLDFYWNNYFQNPYKLTSALTPERSDWVYDNSENFKKIIIKIEDWLLDWDGKTSFAFYHPKTGDAEYRYKNVSRFDFIDDNKMRYTYGEPGKDYYYHRTGKQKEKSNEGKVSGSNCPENGKWIKLNSGGAFFINIECKGDDLSIKLFSGQTVNATKLSYSNPMFPGKTLWQCIWPTMEGGHKDEYCTIVRGEDNVISLYWQLTNNNADWRMDFVRDANENKTIGSNQNGKPNSSSSIAGTWNGDNGRSGTIVMASDGFTWTNQGQSNGYLFKKTGTDTYRFDDGGNYCIVKFLSDTKLDYSCNGSHYAYFERRQ
jgi:hypothetical protein